jgi:hypothetical protein
MEIATLPLVARNDQVDYETFSEGKGEGDIKRVVRIQTVPGYYQEAVYWPGNRYFKNDGWAYRFPRCY